MAGLPPMGPIGPSRGGARVGGKRGMGIGKRDYTPVSWDNHFSSQRDIKVNENTFRVYESGDDGPVCFLLHGGGFSALTWALFSEHLCNAVHCRCVALDMRGHGDTYTTDDYALSSDQQASDVRDVIEKMYGDDPPPIVLVGHSMGGAIAVHIAAQELLPTLAGLAVIDVVEGTALEALTSMQSFLRGRPATFPSLEHAIEWCVRSGHVRNLESAKCSMVGQVKRIDSDVPATADVASTQTTLAAPSSAAYSTDITEEEEEQTTSTDKPETEMKAPTQIPSTETYTWRIDLAKTEGYWRGWFEGLSQKFLASNVPKMLLLAGVDRLDKELTVGQMQGKFQMQVLPQAGHAVHEDVADKVADVVATFLVRQRMAATKDGFQQTFPAC